MHAAALGRAALGQRQQRVGELDLAAAPGRGVAQHVEHGGVADVAADQDPVAGRRAGHRLLHQVRDRDHVLLGGRRDRRAAVLRDLLRVHFHQRHHAAAVALAHPDHPGQQRVTAVDDVVAEQHRERLGADVLGGAQDGMAEPLRVALAHVVHGGELAGLAHLGEPLGVLLGGQRLFQLVGPVEVVLDGALAPPGDHQHVVQAGRDGLLHDVLDGRLVDHRQHLLGRGLGRGQEPGTQAGGGDDGLGHVLAGHGHCGGGISHARTLANFPG